MKTITCNACDLVLKEKEFRLIARIRSTYSENEPHINCIVHEGMEFCSSKCLKEFLDLQLKELHHERD